MEHAQDLDVPLRRDALGNPIMSVEQNPNFRALSVLVAGFWERQEDLGALMNAPNRPVRGRLVIISDVVVDFLQPSPRLGGPDYLRHDSRVFPISSWLNVRPACESARPRSIIAANANSLRISSNELSSGCSSITRRSRSFGVVDAVSMESIVALLPGVEPVALPLTSRQQSLDENWQMI